MKLSIRIFTVSFILCFFSMNSNAEDINIDSLRMSVLQMPDDTLKVIELAKLSKKYSRYQIDTAQRIGHQALNLARELEYRYGEAYSLYMLGVTVRYANEYDLSIKYLNTAYEIFDNLGNEKYKARALNSTGNVYKNKGEFSQALEVFLEALSISKSSSDTVLTAALYNNIGNLYYRMVEYDKALEYQLENLALKKRLQMKDKIPKALMNIANIYKAKDNYDQALDYYNQALKLMDDINNKFDRALLLHNIAGVYEDIERYDIARKYYINAINIYQEIGNKDQLAGVLQGLGSVLIETGNFEEGEKYLLESYQLAKEVDDWIKLANIVYTLEQAYKKIGNYKLSLEYMELYDDVKDSVYSYKMIKEKTRLEEQFEAKKREQQIVFLEKEQRLQELELAKREVEAKQKSFQRNVLILVSLLAIALVIYYFRANKKRRRINLLLLKQNKKITDQRTEIVKQNDELVESNKTKDRLFQIIAHDLRSPLVSIDSVTQLIPYWVEEQDYESLKKLSSTLELSVKNVLSLIDNLLNWALSQQGKFPYTPENLRLVENISEAIDVYKPIAEIKYIDLTFTYTKNVIVFADRNMLFTVMRNLLNNAIKFTPEGGKIEVGIDSNTQFAKIWVKDSGVGISEEKKEMVFELASGNDKGTRGEAGKGLGLFFCKEFVNMNNGDIFIESFKGEGTTITFTLPLFNIAEN